MKLTIAIPVYITQDVLVEFTEQTVRSIRTQHDYKIYIIANYCKPEFKARMQALGEFIDNPDGNCLASAWNLGLKLGQQDQSDYILLPNNDIIFHADCIDNLVSFAQQHPEFQLWTAAEWRGNTHEENNQAIKSNLATVSIGSGFDDHPHFSCFMVGANFTDTLAEKEINTQEPKPGYFDEQIRPAYFEDGDMHQRLLRAGLKAGKTATALFYHFGSRTINVDEDIDITNKHTYEVNRRYFISKWGFDPHNCVLSNDDPKRFVHKSAFEKQTINN